MDLNLGKVGSVWDDYAVVINAGKVRTNATKDLKTGKTFESTTRKFLLLIAFNLWLRVYRG